MKTTQTLLLAGGLSAIVLSAPSAQGSACWMCLPPPVVTGY